MSTEGIFRFTTFRAAREKLRFSTTRTRFFLFTKDTETALYQAILQAKAAGVTRADLAALGESFKKTPLYIRDPRALSLDVTPLLLWATKNAHAPIDKLDIASELGALDSIKLVDLTNSEAFRKTRDSLADTILADALSARREEFTEDVTTAFKLPTTRASAADGAERRKPASPTRPCTRASQSAGNGASRAYNARARPTFTDRRRTPRRADVGKFWLILSPGHVLLER